MSTFSPPTTASADEAAGALAEQTFAAGTATLELACLYLGDRLGLYTALADGAAATATELAARRLDDRVRFFVHDAAEDELTGAYDLVTVFEALHDMARPVDALRAVRGLLADGGSVIVADERAGERFTAPAEEPMDRLFYGFSVLHCLPVGRADGPSAATGTVMRPQTLRDYATQAGFTRVDVLPIEHDVWRFYRLS